MTTKSKVGWQTALDDIEHAIVDCLAALDRYEATFVTALNSQLDDAQSSAAQQATTHESTTWEERLAAAGDAADAVEKLLAEQEQVWGRWRTALADWQRLAAENGTKSRSVSTNMSEGI
jgi:predicted  nucleic acid-binding Zn-ribbon protein